MLISFLVLLLVDLVCVILDVFIIWHEISCEIRVNLLERSGHHLLVEQLLFRFFCDFLDRGHVLRVAEL